MNISGQIQNRETFAEFVLEIRQAPPADKIYSFSPELFRKGGDQDMKNFWNSLGAKTKTFITGLGVTVGITVGVSLIGFQSATDYGAWLQTGVTAMAGAVGAYLVNYFRPGGTSE